MRRAVASAAVRGRGKEKEEKPEKREGRRNEKGRRREERLKRERRKEARSVAAPARARLQEGARGAQSFGCVGGASRLRSAGTHAMPARALHANGEEEEKGRRRARQRRELKCRRE